MAPRSRLRRALARAAKRVSRVLVLFAVILSVFGGSISVAAAAVAQLASAPTCHCPHDDDGEDDRRACPCCNTEDGKGHCLPIGGSCGAPASLAPPIANDTLIPLPPLTGIVTTPEVATLSGRTSALRLERPPRA